VSILWGPEKQLDYWAALEAGVVPEAERRAMGLLASISDEKRFSFYCLSGMFPAMGNVTKRIYMVRRWTTVLELEDGRPKASWCILAQDRMIAPETDHVVAMKNILEGSELDFRQIGNAFHYSEDPFRGTVHPSDLKTGFPNPYYNQVGPSSAEVARSQEIDRDTFDLVDTRLDSMQPVRVPNNARMRVEREWNEDSALQFRELEGWMKTLRMKAEFHAEDRLSQERNKQAARENHFRQWLFREALVERAKDWVRIPPKERYKLPKTEFERLSDRTIRAMNNYGAQFGLGGVQIAGGAGMDTMTNTGQITFAATNATTANFYVNTAATVPVVGLQWPPLGAHGQVHANLAPA